MNAILVIAGLEPAIQGRRKLDARVEPTAVRFSFGGQGA